MEESGLTILSHGPVYGNDQRDFRSDFPPGLFDWFEITDGRSDAQHGSLTLTEKDLPPLSNAQSPQKIVARKFHDLTITDCPLRGNRTRRTFRRRYGKLEGQDEYLTRDIPLCFPGPQLEQAVADFLKAASGE